MKNSNLSNIEIGLKGIGLTLIDNKPKELFFICIDEIDFKY